MFKCADTHQGIFYANATVHMNASKKKSASLNQAITMPHLMLCTNTFPLAYFVSCIYVYKMQIYTRALQKNGARLTENKINVPAFYATCFKNLAIRLAYPCSDIMIHAYILPIFYFFLRYCDRYRY